jgi:hypothetical protein
VEQYYNGSTAFVHCRLTLSADSKLLLVYLFRAKITPNSLCRLSGERVVWLRVPAVMAPVNKLVEQV